MSLKWVDVLEIAIQLAESKPEVDPRYVNFVDLHKWVLALPEFSDDPSAAARRCSRPFRPPGSKKPTKLRRTQLGNTQEPAYNSRV
jgi:FeS assembly protein IscX